MSVKIYLCRFPAKRRISARQLSCLPALQQHRFDQLKGSRAITYFWSRTLLLELLQPVGDDWQLTERSGLPPKLNASNVDEFPSFGISHCGDLLAIAVAPRGKGGEYSLGLDIERINPARSLSIATMFCNQQQLNSMHKLRLEQRLPYMIKLWTQKEAWFKKSNTSILNPDLKDLSFEPAPTSEACIHTTLIDSEHFLSISGEVSDPIVITRREISTNAEEPVLFKHEQEMKCVWQHYRPAKTALAAKRT